MDYMSTASEKAVLEGMELLAGAASLPWLERP